MNNVNSFTQKYSFNEYCDCYIFKYDYLQEVLLKISIRKKLFHQKLN